MLKFLASLKEWALIPLKPFTSASFEDDALGANERSRALWFGLPAFLFAALAVTVLLGTEYGMMESLEERYQLLVEQNSAQRAEMEKKLGTDVNMLKQQFVGKTIDELIPPDDPRRVEYAEAVDREKTYLNKLNALNPDEPEYLFELAKLMIRQGQLSKGLAMMNRISPVGEPGYINGHLFLADLYLKMRAPSEAARRSMLRMALDHADNALTRDQTNIPALQIKGLILKGSKNPDNYPEAYEQYEKLFNQGFITAYRDLYELNLEMGRTDRNPRVLRLAVDELQKRFRETALDSDQRNVFRSAIVECYVRMGDPGEAEKFLNAEIDRLRDGDFQLRIADVKDVLARVFLSRLSNVDPDAPDADRQRLQMLTEAYKNAPTNESVLRQLARLGFSQDKALAADARKVYDATTDKNPPAIVINELGINALSESRYEDSLKYFNQARQKKPDDAEILNNLAYTFLKGENSDPKLSLRLVNQALKQAEVNGLQAFESNFLDTRARAQMQLGNYDSAIADFLKALESRPDNQAIIESLVDCYRKNGMTAEADVWAAELKSSPANTSRSEASGG